MKIFCVGRNYAEHARELNNEVPEEPVIFIKPKSALVLPHTGFMYPEFSNELHYEAELVIRICRNGRHIPVQVARAYYNAVTVGIDFTARDLQSALKKKGLPWEKAKAWDGSAYTGDWTTLDPESRLDQQDFSLRLNGEEVQKGNASHMIFGIDEIIANISTYFSLNIGDLIFTGTPAGVGECVVGDQLEGFLGAERVFDLIVE